ncbi:hypothetical protein [Rummeliibacillus suwonensis]|uniref:hypothetical protein n=1 Tax=Rummeliibacillus suwonensis TaxID=1306154 RepID=UPI001AAF876A|nr:hypothetical protein [Rummeliibacillus suwonensis]MBO2536532.1 hypothetical protein [Rummeliibacillus suwonensis]
MKKHNHAMKPISLIVVPSPSVPTPELKETVHTVNGNVPFTEFDFEVDDVLKGDQSIQATAVKVLQDGNQYNEFIEHPLMEI